MVNRAPNLSPEPSHQGEATKELMGHQCAPPPQQGAYKPSLKTERQSPNPRGGGAPKGAILSAQHVIMLCNNISKGRETNFSLAGLSRNPCMVNYPQVTLSSMNLL